MMNHLKFAAFTAAILLLSTVGLNSQWPSTTKAPFETLKDIKTANEALIDQQKKTLDALDDMASTAEEVRILGKRN